MLGHAAANLVRPGIARLLCRGPWSRAVPRDRATRQTHRETEIPLALPPAAQQTPVVASNRIGTEEFEKSSITFYGGAFIAGPHGEILEQARGCLLPGAGQGGLQVCRSKASRGREVSRRGEPAGSLSQNRQEKSCVFGWIPVPAPGTRLGHRPQTRRKSTPPRPQPATLTTRPRRWVPTPRPSPAATWTPPPSGRTGLWCTSLTWTSCGSSGWGERGRRGAVGGGLGIGTLGGPRRRARGGPRQGRGRRQAPGVGWGRGYADGVVLRPPPPLPLLRLPAGGASSATAGRTCTAPS